jgi:hypothetical protein
MRTFWLKSRETTKYKKCKTIILNQIDKVSLTIRLRLKKQFLKEYLKFLLNKETPRKSAKLQFEEVFRRK